MTVQSPSEAMLYALLMIDLIQERVGVSAVLIFTWPVEMNMLLSYSGNV